VEGSGAAQDRGKGSTTCPPHGRRFSESAECGFAEFSQRGGGRWWPCWLCTRVRRRTCPRMRTARGGMRQPQLALFPWQHEDEDEDSSWREEDSLCWLCARVRKRTRTRIASVGPVPVGGRGQGMWTASVGVVAVLGLPTKLIGRGEMAGYLCRPCARRMGQQPCWPLCRRLEEDMLPASCPPMSWDEVNATAAPLEWV
jgi:hypothetical protein